MTDCGWSARPPRATYHTTTTTTRCSVHAIHEEYGHVQLTKTSDAQILFHPHCHPPSQPHRDPLQRPPLNIALNSHTERQSSRSSGWGRHEGDTNKWWPVLCQINPRPVCLILWVSLSVGPYVGSWSWPDRPRGFYLTTESHSSSAVSSCCTHNTSATEYILLAT